MAQPAIATATTTLQLIAEFRALHDKLRNGTLSLSEQARYTDQRKQFVRMMMLSQLGVTGQTLRSELRMSKMVKVEIRPESAAPERTTTLEIASKGFATLLPRALKVGTVCGFTLHLPKPAGAIMGRAVVASERPHGTAIRTSFLFDNLVPQVAEQLDIALIDAIFERLTKKL